LGIPILHIDAFTSEPFKGNPAAVCLLDEPWPAEWMQNVAAEMNLSETAAAFCIADSLNGNARLSKRLTDRPAA
jgi:PhzF family phenazine biosynthesis protein